LALHLQTDRRMIPMLMGASGDSTGIFPRFLKTRSLLGGINGQRRS
jgi:hypothetical protein